MFAEYSFVAHAVAEESTVPAAARNPTKHALSKTISELGMSKEVHFATARHAHAHSTCARAVVGRPDLRARARSQEFCERRSSDATLAGLTSQSLASAFCEGKRIKRRGTIANGKLDGTALAAYWNLEKAPSSKAGVA